jgi:hypothetical protein
MISFSCSPNLRVKVAQGLQGQGLLGGLQTHMPLCPGLVPPGDPHGQQQEGPRQRYAIVHLIS